MRRSSVVVRGGGVSWCRSSRSRRGLPSGSRSSCVRPMTMLIGGRRAARRVRSGSRRSRSSDHRTAVRITQTSVALRSLPALDHALSTGALTLDQVAAAAEFATPESDAELARVAVGKPPSAIGLVARTLAPPVVEDDQALYARRALSMSGRAGGASCVQRPAAARAGRVFEQAIWDIAKQQRAADKQTGSVIEWQQSAADALVTLAQTRRRRRRCAAQRDDADRASERRRAAVASRAPGRLSPRDRRTARLRRAPPHDQAQRARPRPLARRALRVLRAAARAAQALRPLPVPRLHRHRASSKHTTSSPTSTAARPSSPT